MRNPILSRRQMSNFLTPFVKGGILPAIPSGFQRVLQHLIGGVDADHLEAFFQQHYGVDAGAAGDVQYSVAFLLPQQAHQEVPVVLRTLLLVADEDLPHFRRLAIRVLIPYTFGWCAQGTSTKHGIHHCKKVKLRDEKEAAKSNTLCQRTIATRINSIYWDLSRRDTCPL